MANKYKSAKRVNVLTFFTTPKAVHNNIKDVENFQNLYLYTLSFNDKLESYDCLKFGSPAVAADEGETTTPNMINETAKLFTKMLHKQI